MHLRRLTRSLRSRFFLSFMAAFLPVVVVLALSVEIFYVPWLKTRSLNELSTATRVLTQAVRAGASVAVRNHLQAIAEAAREITLQHLRLVDQGVLERDEALARVKAILLGQKIGTSGYIYCLNSQGRITLHPSAAVQDSNLSDFDFIREQMKRKEGYIEYDWRNPGEPVARAKALYMTYVPELDWIISVSSYRAEFHELLDPADIRDVVLSARFGKTGYAWVVSHSGEVLIHPKLPPTTTCSAGRYRRTSSRPCSPKAPAYRSTNGAIRARRRRGARSPSTRIFPSMAGWSPRRPIWTRSCVRP